MDQCGTDDSGTVPLSAKIKYTRNLL
ncbi:unnamed protein product [Urochloa humidicola]